VGTGRTTRLSRSQELVAFLGALCLFFSTLEFLIPKPIPFLRIGIANLPVLIALELLTPGELFLLVLLKVIGQGLVSGTLVSYVALFSAAGSFSAAAVMLAAYRLFTPRISLIGVSVLGALANNGMQIVLARLLVFGNSAWLIAPPFLAIGTVTSAALGIFASRFARESRWLAMIRAGQ
jgi:heptaprenyl diphosphate synthase